LFELLNIRFSVFFPKFFSDNFSQAVHVIVNEYHKYHGSTECFFSSIIPRDSLADLDMETAYPELT